MYFCEMDIVSTLIVSTFGFSFFFNYSFNKWFLKNKKLDEINSRSSHLTSATKSGGIALFTSLFLISIILYSFEKELFDFSLIIPLGIIFIIGVYDDFYNANFKLKFFIQIIVSKIFIDQGLIIDDFHGFLGFYGVSYLFSQITTMFVFLIIVNAINFIDGIDGLAISLCIIFLFFMEFLYQGESELYYLNIVCVMSLLPLYYFNFKKQNKVFLGDAGSLYLGAVISINVFSFLSNISSSQKIFDFNPTLLSITILFYPLIDLLRVFIIRIKQKRSPFMPDNSHLHHVFLNHTKSNHAIASFLILIFSILLILFILVIEYYFHSICTSLILLGLSIVICLMKFKNYSHEKK